MKNNIIKLKLGWEFTTEDEEYYQLTLARVERWGKRYFGKKQSTNNKYNHHESKTEKTLLSNM